jgi:hypothetical protein
MTLVDTIKRTLLEERPAAKVFPNCFCCGVTYSKGDGRFCSTRCRDAYDAGFPAYRPTVVKYSLPIRGAGFEIICAGCRQPFSSKGLRCCSQACERKHREREEIAAVMAEAGLEPSERRKCEDCGGNIPRWTGVGKARREVRKDARFCSSRCSQKSRSGSQTAERCFKRDRG